MYSWGSFDQLRFLQYQGPLYGFLTFSNGRVNMSGTKEKYSSSSDFRHVWLEINLITGLWISLHIEFTRDSHQKILIVWCGVVN